MQGKARQSKAKQDKARQSKAKPDKARQTKAKQDMARQSEAKQGKARESKAKQGEARQSKARQGKARESKAKQGNRTRSFLTARRGAQVQKTYGKQVLGFPGAFWRFLACRRPGLQNARQPCESMRFSVCRRTGSRKKNAQQYYSQRNLGTSMSHPIDS